MPAARLWARAAAGPIGEEAGQREHEEQLPELGGLELERADLDPPFRAASRIGEREDQQHPDERDAEDRLLRAAVPVGVDQEHDEEAGEAEPGCDRLPDDVVVLVALDVEAGDARHRPEPVRHYGADGEEQDPVEPAEEADDVDVVASHRAGSLRVLNHWRPPPGRRAFSRNQCSKTFSAAGAATEPPWPPFSITAQTTIGVRFAPRELT